VGGDKSETLFLALGNHFLTTDHQAQAEIAHFAAGEETGTAAARLAALTAFFWRRYADRPNTLIELARNAIFLDHHHRQFEQRGPGTPIGGNVIEIMGNQQWDRQMRVGMHQFQSDSNITKLVFRSTRRHTAESASRQGQRDRQIAYGQQTLHNRSAFVQREGDIAAIIARGIGNGLGQMEWVKPEFPTCPNRLCSHGASIGFFHVTPSVDPESRFSGLLFFISL
jgi:hypothetical protein